MLAGLAVLLVIIAASFVLVERTQTFFDEVLEARDVRVAAVELRNAINMSETGQRGFLLTGEEDHLAPYLQTHERVLPLLDQLDAMLAVYPQAQEVRVQLAEATAAKLDELQRTVALAREGRLAESLAIVREGSGQDQVDTIRDILARIIAAADVRLIEGIEGQRESATLLRWINLFGALAIIVIVGGSAAAVISYTRDLVRARELLASMNEQLEQRVAVRTADLARANEEVQRFAYIVTHDLRAPLVNIMGFTSELEASLTPIRKHMERADPGSDPLAAEARVAATEDLPEAIDFIRSSTRKMDGLINAILKISRDGRRPLKPERLALGDVLQAAADAIHHQVVEGDGEIVVSAGFPEIVSDRLALEQIFGNLLDNAVKYADPARPLRVELRGRALPADRYLVEVVDNGRGIAVEDHERIFELFRRSGQQNTAGEGIGLAHVRTLIRNLGGDITVSSEPGRGSTFAVVLARDLNKTIGSSS